MPPRQSLLRFVYGIAVAIYLCTSKVHFRSSRSGLRIDATRSIRAIMTLFECVSSSCTLTGYRQIAHIIRCCLPLMIKNTKPLLLAGKCFASVGADLSLHGHRVNENNIIIGCTSHIYSFWPTHSRQKRRPVFIFNINRTAQFNRPRE